MKKQLNFICKIIETNLLQVRYLHKNIVENIDYNQLKILLKVVYKRTPLIEL